MMYIELHRIDFLSDGQKVSINPKDIVYIQEDQNGVLPKGTTIKVSHGSLVEDICVKEKYDVVLKKLWEIA